MSWNTKLCSAALCLFVKLEEFKLLQLFIKNKNSFHHDTSKVVIIKITMVIIYLLGILLH